MLSSAEFPNQIETHLATTEYTVFIWFLANPHLDQEPGCKHLPDLLDLGPFPKVGTYVSMDVVPQATDFQKVLHSIGISLSIFLRVFQDGFRV